MCPGAGEQPTDLGLMAHELTHVAQQGGAGARATQRKVNVGEANSPAGHEADAVSSPVTGGPPPLPTWALHRPVRTGEYDQPRANAIRFQFYQKAYRYIFEAGYP
jgi:hypothetical protein